MGLFLEKNDKIKKKKSISINMKRSEKVVSNTPNKFESIYYFSFKLQ